MGSEEHRSRIEKFDGSDFAYWKTQMEDYLYQKDLYRPLMGKAKAKKEKETDDEWAILDRKAIGQIRLSLSKSVAHLILKETTMVGLMESLATMYEQPSAVNKVHLMKKLFNLKMAEGCSFTKHLSEFHTIVDQLTSVGIPFEDEIQALLVLSQLPDSWAGSVTAISNSTGKEKLKLNEVVSMVLSEEVRRKSSEVGTSGSGTALNIEQRGRSQKKGQNRDRSKSKKRAQSAVRPIKGACWNCGQTGHMSSTCKAPKKEKNEQEAHVLQDALILAMDGDVDSWVVDSGASFHATPNGMILENYVSKELGKVYLGDDEPCNIVGIGDVTINLMGSKWCLKNVRHVPKLTRSLISVGQLGDDGYVSTFTGDSWKISKGAMVVARGKRDGTLYLTSPASQSLAVASGSKVSNLWHNRLGHMSEKGMKMLHSQGKLPDIDSVEVDLCEDCIFGKQKRVSFQKGGRPSKACNLELIHTDVWGPASVDSLGGSRYFVTFIDDHSRKVWVYFLKRKAGVFNTFLNWKVMVENETNLKVKRLRSDNGGEYEKEEFLWYCAAHGIHLEKTTPGTPQLNGVAERMNKTLTERARSMRLHSGLPKCFWADAVNTAAYLINRGPSVPLNFGIPEEVWSGKEVTLSHLRIFGCTAYVHISDHGRDKLDAKSKKCYFIGYGGDAFGYRLWDEANKKIIRSRDVVFDESVMYKDRNASSGSTTEDAESSEFMEVEDLPDVIVGEANFEQVHEPVTEQVAEIEPVAPIQPLRRSTRTPKPNQKYVSSLYYLLLTDSGEPESYAEAKQVHDANKWSLAMQEEMESLYSNDTWKLAKLPAEKKALHNKWVYRVKQESNGDKRYKARLVVKGFEQKEGIDYTEIFSPVVKMTTIRVVLSMVAAENLFLEQLDVKTAFLHGDLNEEIYMEQPVGFIQKGKEGMVCRLKKSLYGLKQAPRQWYRKFDSFMQRNDFTKCNADHCCYFKRFASSYVILLLYVDDMLVAGPSLEEITKLKQQLASEFAMKDLGEAKQMLGMRISRDRGQRTLKLSQTEYVEKVLQRFNMHDAKAVSTPLGSQFRLSTDQSPKTDAEMRSMEKVPYASAIGSLMYAMVCTRPDIAHAVGVVSRFASNPGKEHWEAVKWILCYLKGTKESSLCYGKGKLCLQGYVDADFAGDHDT